MEATKLDKNTSFLFGWLISGSQNDNDCNRVITNFCLYGSDGTSLLNTAFVRNIEKEGVGKYVLRGTLLPRPGSEDDAKNPVVPLRNFVCQFRYEQTY